MDAIISGRAGVALLVEGDRLHSFEVGEPLTLWPRRPSEVRLLFDDAPDLRVLENVSHEEAARQLEHAADRADALDLTLLLLDPELPAKDRAEAAAALEGLLDRADVGEYVENVLLARPLPEGADLDSTVTLRPDLSRVAELLEELRNRQPAVRAVRFAWEAIPAADFDAEATRDEFQRMAVEERIFSQLVKSYPEPPSPDFVQALDKSLPSRYQPALAHWRAALEASARVITFPRTRKVDFSNSISLSDVIPGPDRNALLTGRPRKASAPPSTGTPRQQGDRKDPDTTQRLSTSLLSVDALTGGLPRGHIVQFSGLRGTGKRSLASLAVGSANEADVGVLHVEILNSSVECAVSGKRFDYERMELETLSGDDLLSRVLRLMVSKEIGLVVVNDVPSLVDFNYTTDLTNTEVEERLGRVLNGMAAAAAASGACVVFIDHTAPREILWMSVERTRWRALGEVASMQLHFEAVSQSRQVRIGVTKNETGSVSNPPVVLELTEGGEFSREGELFDLGLAHNLIQQVNFMYFYGKELLGATREGCTKALKEKPEVQRALHNQLLTLLDLQHVTDPYPTRFWEFRTLAGSVRRGLLYIDSDLPRSGEERLPDIDPKDLKGDA
jgi:recombination protein RecA